MRIRRAVALVAGSMVALAAIGTAATQSGAATADSAASTGFKKGTLNGDTYLKVPSPTSTTFQPDGPYAVGTYTMTVSVTDANNVTYSTPVDVWYPTKIPTSPTAVRQTYNVGHWLPTSLQAIIDADPVKQAIEAQATFTEDAYQYAKTKTKRGVTTGTVPKPANGRFPLVLFSHGYSGFRDQSTYLTTHLASWGFVVVAPDQQSRVLTTVLGAPSPTTDPNSDVDELMATVQQFVAGNGGTAQAVTDPSQVIAFGHSAGGSAVERLASYLTATQGSSTYLKGFIGMAGADFKGLSSLSPPYNTMPAMPALLTVGGNDQIAAPSVIQTAYNELTGTKRYVELTGAGHLVYSDLCQISPGQGGLTVLASALGITLSGSLQLLATDGCFAPDNPVTTDWPLVDQLVVAGARHMLGFDVSDAGLANLATDYPALVTTDTTAQLP